ncbi:thrombospondin type-1 domain-containing protein 4 [Lampris incognitus]|uniref:thrombospondin type-1 domain-containing protein 4 n=1 Tax=Lampris incognitus TaxID=2546036 RepID=UPI0024B48A80|nr:thrombospondin type-1 domain-containing protein 4 [Lampris incognitus]
MGRLYNWEPFTEVGPDKQCELTCRPAGYRFYVRQAERVRDGTPCFNLSTNDVCVDGQCMTEGCDGVLGSGSVIDRCGVCGGGENSCRKVTGSFQNATVPLGYHKILDIPVGATFINITERRASPNYLAMRSGTGASVVNGRWVVDPPGEYQAGGTTFTYTRPRAQAEGQEEKGESLTAPGPITTQLQLYIIFHRQNPGIDYRFYVPAEKTEAEKERPREREVARERPRDRDGPRAPLRSAMSVEDHVPPLPPISGPSFPSSSSASSSSDRWTSERSRPRSSAPNRNARIPPRTDLPPDTQPPFVWRRGGLTECSASCGKGSQHRVILCINRHTDQEVPERKCDSAAKPIAEEEPCNTNPCPPFWEASAWSECSVSCGEGVQQRQLQCRQSFGNRSTMVHPQRCATLTPPASTQTCQLRLCSHWEADSDWSTCSVDCGLGRRTRSVHCVSDHGDVVNDKECNSRLRPQGSEECNMGPCVTNWYFTDWSNTCSAQCGPGVQRREVVCLTRGGGREDGDCVGEKPAEMKACNRGACVPTTMWYSSPWTPCNVPCGNGTQRRDIICVQKMGNDFTLVPPGECAHLDKPTAVQECEMGSCKPRWFTTEWSACSRSCGKGVQMREVRCLSADKQHSQDCDFIAKPEQEQICNTIPCSPQVTDENCRDRRHNCMMVVQARLCVYSYYKTACCASCTQSAQRAKRH